MLGVTRIQPLGTTT